MKNTANHAHADLFEIERLAEAYAKDVAARRRLGDANAEYHARAPKVEAYRLLLEAGYSVKETVEIFRRVVAETKQ